MQTRLPAYLDRTFGIFRLLLHVDIIDAVFAWNAKCLQHLIGKMDALLLRVSSWKGVESNEHGDEYNVLDVEILLIRSLGNWAGILSGFGHRDDFYRRSTAVNKDRVSDWVSYLKKYS